MTLPIKSTLPETAEGPGPKTAGGPADDSGRSKRGNLRRMGSSARFIWPVVCLFQLGLFAGLYFARGNGEPSATIPDDSHATESNSTDLNSDKPTVAGSASSGRSIADCARADEYLKRGWYEQALTRYESSNEGRTGEMPSSTRFKIALCLEGLGQWDRAIAELGEIAGRGATDQVTSAARLARARLWFRMRNVDEAKLALGDLLLKSTPGSSSATPVAAELSQLLGLTLAMDALGTEAPGPKRESTLAFSSLEWRPESQCVWTESPASESFNKPESNAKVPGSLDVWPTGPAVHDCDVTLTAKRGAVSAIIQQVADSANVTCVWTDAARKVADQRVTEVSTGRLSWPTLIACLTEPLQITWELRDDKLQFSAFDEVSDEDRAERRAKTATLILSATARDAHRSPEAAIAYLGLGNLAYADGQPEAAVTWFERFVKEFPRSAQCVVAYFNLGVVKRSMGDPAASRAAFLHAVDTSPTHPLVPLAHLFVGRIHLDECDPEGAVAPLRRAASMVNEADTRPAAVIDMATALMLAGNWRTANALLQENHALLEPPEFRDSAAFLGTYARYQTLTGRKKAHREGQALVTALMGIKSDSALPNCGVLLVGRAYAELGLSEQMAETYEQALQRDLPEPIAHEIIHELAEFAQISGKGNEATKHFTALFENASPAKSRRAGMRIAEIALAEQRADDCLATCRKLLKDAEKPDLPAILRLMGKAFEQAGDHQRAAQCFAGQRPNP